MTRVNQRSLVAITALAIIAFSAHAQQPPDSVTSDAYGNTAMGIDALFDNGTPNEGTPVSVYNTAAGSRALEDNTTGYSGSAFGGDALTSNTTGYSNSAFG